jgi:PadR family transcriptional regulator PadR
MKIGEFEYLLLTAAERLGEDAYGAAIRLEIETVTKRRCSIGALYTTLDRLEKKRLVKTWMGESTPERGGRAKRMVRVTGEGTKAAAAFYETVIRMSRGVSWATHPERAKS